MAARPERIANVLAELMARRGYARQSSAEACVQAWSKACGPALAPYTRVGQLKRGALEVMVANSAIMQELTFVKANLLRVLKVELPDTPVKDLRFRIGSFE